MKIAETMTVEGNSLHIVQTHDLEPSLDRSAFLRSNDLGRFGESEAIGSIPGAMASQWLRDAGLRWDSPREEIRQLFVRKLCDGEFSKLRISNRARP